MRFSFLFDIFLGHSYNQLPPSVKYMTVAISLFYRPNRSHARFVDQWRQIPIQPQLIRGMSFLDTLRKKTETFYSRTAKYAYRS